MVGPLGRDFKNTLLSPLEMFLYGGTAWVALLVSTKKVKRNEFDVVMSLILVNYELDNFDNIT